MSKKLLVTQIGSPIARQARQRKNLIGLGLNKIGRARILLNDKSTLGMINQVKHLVSVVEVSE